MSTYTTPACRLCDDLIGTGLYHIGPCQPYHTVEPAKIPKEQIMNSTKINGAFRGSLSAILHGMIVKPQSKINK